MTSASATYQTDEVEIIFSATVRRPFPDEDQGCFDDIEVEKATILGVTVTKKDVSPALWAAIENIGYQADFVEDPE